MNQQPRRFNFNFFEQTFLDDLKKESLSRSKPSKAVLDALKHSTSLNKQHEAKIQTLSSQLISATQQNNSLKHLLSNLKSQIESLKCQKQESNSKLSQLLTEYKAKIEFVINENDLLKRQIQLLKIKLVAKLIGDKDGKIWKGQEPKMVKKQSPMISEIPIIEKNHTCETSLTDIIPLQQSTNFIKYLNYDQMTEKTNEQTQPNSKLKLETYEEPQIQSQKNKNTDQQCDELTNLLNSKQQSQISKDFHEYIQQLSPRQRLIPSIQEITPKIVEVTSKQEIFIDQQYRAQTPKLPKSSFNQSFGKQNQNELKFKVFEENLKISGLEQFQGLKNADITFFNLDTRKSIEAVIEGTFLNKFEGENASKDQIIEEKDKIGMEKKSLDNEASKYLKNFNGVDLSGLMNDIDISYFQNEYQDIKKNETQSKEQYEDSLDPEAVFYKTQYFKSIQRNSNVSLDQITKRSVSQLYEKGRKGTIVDQLKEPLQQSKMASIENQIPSISSGALSQQNPKNVQQKHDRNQKIKTAFKTPFKYMSITQSYKTIDFTKSNKQLKQNQNKSGESIDRINEIEKSNGSSFSSKNRAQESGSKSMTISKLIMFNNTRNKKNKSLSPLSASADSGTENDCAGSNERSERNEKSYPIIQSIQKNKLNQFQKMKESLLVPDESDQLNDSQNYSTFRKKFYEKDMTRSAFPDVAIKDFDPQCDGQSQC